MSNVEAIKKADNAPDRIWATVNGMSTRYPDGSRQLIGGWQQDAGRAESVEYVRATTIEALQRENDELRNLSDRMKNEAQTHAMEARGANATINEIYQIISGGKGEPGNWKGAGPVRLYVEAVKGEILRLETELVLSKPVYYRRQIEARVKSLEGALTGLVEDLEARSVNGTVNCSHGVYCTAREVLANAGEEHHAE